MHFLEGNAMRVIITGGTGFIGGNLATGLVKEGNEVIILSRNPERHAVSYPPGTRVVRWDGRSAEGWVEVANGADAIVNLAGENISSGRWTEARKRTILESRVNAGRAIVQAVEQAIIKPRVVIQASGVDYYGPHKEEFITEADAAGKSYLAQVCVDWERSTAPVEKFGIRRAIIRTGLPLSAEGGVLPRLLMPFRLFVGGPLGNGRQWFSWIHLADEIGAIRFLLENESASGPFNLTAPNPLTNRDFARLLGKAINRPSYFPTPAFLLRLMFGEMSSVILGGQRVLPEHLLKSGYKFLYPEPESALQTVFEEYVLVGRAKDHG
jgi:uncharacterized protein